MKILQLGKFYPIRGGVEKVMYTFLEGLSAKGIGCDMLCAECEGAGRTVEVAPEAKVMTCRTLVKAAGTTIAPGMIFTLRRIKSDYDIIHVHHPDPMAALALLLSGYKGKVVLHWHSDIIRQRFFLTFYKWLQNWLVRRADLVVGTTPPYLEHSEGLSAVTPKPATAVLPIGVEPLLRDPGGRRQSARAGPAGR